VHHSLPRAALAALLLWSCLVPLAVSGEQTEVLPTACDLLAAHPSDPARITEGRSRGQIMPEIDRTIAVCRRDAREHDAARLTYYLGRVLFYRGDFEEGLGYVEQAAERGHSQAQFVSALIRAEGVPEAIPADVCRSRALWAEAASNGHYAATLALARHRIAGAFEDCETDGPSVARLREWVDAAAGHERADDFYHGLLIGLLRDRLAE